MGRLLSGSPILRTPDPLPRWSRRPYVDFHANNEERYTPPVIRPFVQSSPFGVGDQSFAQQDCDTGCEVQAEGTRQ